MNRNTSFDWYQFSKINQVSPKLQQFANLIRNSHFGVQINKVPNSLRQKLLITFQNASQKIQKQYFQQQKSIQQFKFNKRVIGQQINVMKQQLQTSKIKITNDKTIIQQKKKLINKLKQKIRRKTQAININIHKQPHKIQKQQTYYCPFCTRQDFSSRNDFTFHMFNQHSKNINNGSMQPNQPAITAQFKQLMLSLKDKEIELMQMMLNKKKQIQAMQLQYAYSQELKKIKTQANFAERKSAYSCVQKKTNRQQREDEQQQLKGQSQYLFYQNNNLYPSYPIEQIDKANKIRSIWNQKPSNYQSIKNHGTHTHTNPNTNTNKRNPTYNYNLIYNEHEAHPSTNHQDQYYNIFSGDIAVSQMDNSLSSHKIPHRIHSQTITEPNPKPNTQHPIQYKIYTEHKSQVSINKDYKLDRSPIKPLQYVPSSTQSKLYTYSAHKTNNRQQQQQLSNNGQPIQTKYQTVYLPSKSHMYKFMNNGHVFNSGPLLDDDSGQSDYQQYFQHNQRQQMDQDVQDQQIRVPTIPQNTHTITNRSTPKQPSNFNPNPKTQLQSGSIIANSKTSQDNNQSNVMLQYSKDKSMLQIEISHSKQKSSDLIQLSNSFSKKALQNSSSNNNQSINLSDLKLSKLDRYKQKLILQDKNKQYSYMRKQQVSQQNIQIVIPQPTYNNNNSNSNSNNNSNSNANSISNKSYSNKSNPSILQQFKRDSQLQIQMKMQRISITKTQKPPQTQAQAQGQTSQNRNYSKIKLPQNIDLMKTNPGVLQEFLYKPSNSLIN